MKRISCAAIIVLALAASIGPAGAQACKLQLLSSVDLTPIAGGNEVLVPVAIQGSQRQLLLGTAGEVSMLKKSVADALGLRAETTRGIRFLGVNGAAMDQFVHLDDVQIGALKGSGIDMIVTDNVPGDGLLGGNLLASYDVDLDFGAHKMNFIAPNDCGDNVVYWQTDSATMVPFTQGTMQTGPGGRAYFNDRLDTDIRITVMLDGKPVKAIIDTGAARTALMADIAKSAFDVTADSPGSTPLGTIDGNPEHKRFGYVFKTLTFGGITVNNPHITVIPDLFGSKDPENGVQTGSLISRNDNENATPLLIGMDVLKRFHLYIAYKARKLYLSPVAASP